ncbi:MAG: SDR family NAD(P)-dependent oxidoreductase [Actinomycetota bacterium]
MEIPCDALGDHAGAAHRGSATGPRFKGKVALITGGSSGIGRATADLLLAEEAKLVIGDLKAPEGLDRQEVLYRVADVRDETQVSALVDAGIDRFSKIDILFNNAGTAGRLPRPPLVDLSVEEWDQTLDINLKGIFLTSKAVVPHMLGAGGGVIVNNASMLGIVGMRESAAYCASKGGAVVLTKSMALELIEHGIRVNCVCGSFIDTPMFQEWLNLQPDPEKASREAVEQLPIKRLGSAQEMARAVAFLVSDEASYLVGHALYVDGGYLAQ